jgi:hypothetical protein
MIETRMVMISPASVVATAAESGLGLGQTAQEPLDG